MSRLHREHAATAKREQLAARIVALAKKEPEMSRRRIAERLGCNVTTVVNALKEAGAFESRARK